MQAPKTTPPLIVDHFAGGGGASTGITLALGTAPHHAINHSETALAVHAANHPGTQHHHSNIWEVRPGDVVQGRPVQLLWSSASCTHHSGAKVGGGPLSAQLRALPWTACWWAARARPEVIICENVQELMTWGPLLADGRPDPARRGETYARWLRRFRALGYEVEAQVLDAADYGAPQHRERLFIIARRDSQAITWPAPTHGPGALTPHVPALTALRPAHRGELLNHRKRPLSATTQARVLAALAQHGTPLPGGGEGALYVYQFGGQGRRLDRPAPTLTTGDRLALVQRDAQGQVWFRSLLVEELSALMGFPQGYQLPTTRKPAVAAIGNAVCPPVAAAVVRAALVQPAIQNAAD